MKRAVALTCFSVGLGLFAFGLAWFLTVLLTRQVAWPLPSGIASIEALFGLWGACMFATFYRSVRPVWTPLIAITGRRVKWAKVVLASALLNSLLWLIATVSAWLVDAHVVLPWLFCVFASAGVLLNGSYLCIHWALRPENLFSERFRRLADDPAVFAIVAIIDALGRPRRTPQ
jgi:hypothetical protein